MTPETIAKIVAEYEAGSATRQLMATYGIGKGPVLRLLREAGANIRTQNHMTTDEISRAIGLYGQGLSVVKIGKAIGVQRNTVYDTLKRQGVQFRSPHDRSAGN